MPPYILELAKSNMSTCKACKDKIAKGTVRFGTEAVIKEHVTYSWRHAACVTPKQIANVKKVFPTCADIPGYEGCNAFQGDALEALRSMFE